MSIAITLNKRTSGAADSARAEGQLPAVIYGHGTEPMAVSLPAGAFTKLYREAGTSTLIDISVDGAAATKGLIQDVQYDPVTGRPIHVDFRLINMNKEMSLAIEFTFVGEAPAAKELGGTFVAGAQSLNIICLPKDLVNHIEVPVATLKTFTDAIHVKDLVLPPGIRTTDNPEMVVAKVLPPLTEEQIKAMEALAQPDIAKIEVEKKGKEVPEEGAAEGGTAPAAEPKAAAKKE